MNILDKGKSSVQENSRATTAMINEEEHTVNTRVISGKAKREGKRTMKMFV